MGFLDLILPGHMHAYMFCRGIFFQTFICGAPATLAPSRQQTVPVLKTAPRLPLRSLIDPEIRLLTLKAPRELPEGPLPLQLSTPSSHSLLSTPSAVCLPAPRPWDALSERLSYLCPPSNLTHWFRPVIDIKYNFKRTIIISCWSVPSVSFI